MTEDLTKLETLSYRPAKSLPATSGMNSAVIKPAKRVNKADIVSHLIEPPNLKIIGEIEGLMSQVNEKLESLSTGAPTTDERFKRKRLKNTALEDIDIFQKTTLFELRKELE